MHDTVSACAFTIRNEGDSGETLRAYMHGLFCLLLFQLDSFDL